MKLSELLYSVTMSNLEQCKTPRQRAEAERWKKIIERNKAAKPVARKPRHGRR